MNTLYNTTPTNESDYLAEIDALNDIIDWNNRQFLAGDLDYLAVRAYNDELYNRRIELNHLHQIA